MFATLIVDTATSAETLLERQRLKGKSENALA